MSGDGRSHFAELKADPGAPGLESLLAEVNKLKRVRRLELPADLFADVSEKLVDAWRARASKEYPANLERMKLPRRLMLLAALCHVRQTEITDSLVDLFIQLVLKINTRAERRVDKAFARDAAAPCRIPVTSLSRGAVKAARPVLRGPGSQQRAPATRPSSGNLSVSIPS
ncbi:hypothetical protein ACIQZB_32305 [Streptomyces sp. NPDC097727]|uniref:hypothetical protein n=1 Tax=Streptomyces sp. NPDC097727 TaxID=3366092 RepID=UPI00381A48B5